MSLAAQSADAPAAANAVKIYPRSEHCISRTQISENALKVLTRLKKADFEAYLVGGCVRDLLLGREPKDFDVATNASPEQVKQIFRNCRIIGRRFRLAHVFFGREIIEVATFRGGVDNEESDRQVVHEDGRLLRDNVFGTLEEDVWRRDFTVNALYYNIRDFSVVDYTGGMQDHAAGVMRLIGDPEVRYREDPVRMIRAIRFAVKLGFTLHPDTEKPIYAQADLLKSIPSARLYDEVLKLFLAGYGLQTFEMLRHYGLFGILFPETERCLATQEQDFPRLFLIRALENSDRRYNDGKTLTPYFLLAALLWEPLQVAAQKRIGNGENETLAYQNAANEVWRGKSRSPRCQAHHAVDARCLVHAAQIFPYCRHPAVSAVGAAQIPGGLRLLSTAGGNRRRRSAIGGMVGTVPGGRRGIAQTNDNARQIRRRQTAQPQIRPLPFPNQAGRQSAMTALNPGVEAISAWEAIWKTRWNN